MDKIVKQTYSTSNTRMTILSEESCSLIECFANSIDHCIDPTFVIKYDRYDEIEKELKNVLKINDSSPEKDHDLVHKILDLGINNTLKKADGLLPVLACYGKKTSVSTIEDIINLFKKA